MKFMDLYKGYDKRKVAIQARIESIIERSQFIFGADLEELEATLAKYVGRKYALGVSSGHDGLSLALMALGFEAGLDHSNKEVIVPALTFFSTAEAPASLGMKVVVCDIDKDTYNMDLNKLESLINKNTVAIIPVNLFGQCIDYDAINTIAKKHNIFVIEDACQSFGASYKSKKSCAFGDIAITSFFPAKPLGCFGDGGMCFTDSDELYAKLKKLRHHGDSGGMVHVMLGTTGRLDNLQAGILLEKFNGFDEDMDLRRGVAEFYTENLRDFLKTPKIESFNESVYAQYVVRADGKDRSAIREYLQKKDIPTALYYPNPIHLAPILEPLGYKEGDMPNAEYVCKNSFALPIYNEMSKDESLVVINALKEAVNN